MIVANPRAYVTEAEVVVKHAQQQRRRGRRPSMSYKNILNPRKALAQAQKDLEIYQPEAPEEYEWIPTTVANMVRIAQLTGKPCTAHLLIGKYVALPTSTFDEDAERLFDIVYQLCEDNDGTDKIRETNEALGLYVQQNILRAVADEVF